MSDNTAVQPRSADEPSTTISPGEERSSREPTPGAAEIDVSTRTVQWRVPTNDTTGRAHRTALFRVMDHRAVLQHVRETTLRQQGGPSECVLDAEASLDDVPERVLEELRVDGLVLATGAVAGGKP